MTFLDNWGFIFIVLVNFCFIFTALIVGEFGIYSLCFLVFEAHIEV